MRHSKLLRLLMLTLMLLLTTTDLVFAGEIGVTMDGTPVIFTKDTGRPFVDQSNRTQVPLRITMEAAGCTVSWDIPNQTAIVTRDGKTVKVPIGKSYILVDGEMVSNDTKAQIKDGRTYLPIRAVLEAFGAKVAWNQVSSRVEVVSDPELVRIMDILKTKVKLEDDITVFTLFAFLNFTGYDDENNSSFHPVRTAVREDLARMGLQLMDNDYYKNKQMLSYQYVHVLKLMDSNFDYKESIPPRLSRLSDLNLYLKEFYEKADIPKLYEKYRVDYQKEQDKYGDDLYLNLAKLVYFLRIDPETIAPFYFNVNLLDSYYRGSGLGSTYAHRSGQGVLLAGPSEKPNHTNVVHEFMHGVLTPIGVKYEAQINSIQYLADKIPYGSKVMASYPNQRAVFDESVIRSLTSLILDQADVVQRETASGFVYTQYFYDNFKSRYPDYTGSFENFMLNLIQDLKAKK